MPRFDRPPPYCSPPASRREWWDIVDYSEDQLGTLALGPLQVLKPVFIARRTEGFRGTEVDDALRRSGLSATRRNVLAERAGYRVHLDIGLTRRTGPALLELRVKA